MMQKYDEAINASDESIRIDPLSADARNAKALLSSLKATTLKPSAVSMKPSGLTLNINLLGLQKVSL
jgi:hypothetical protein